MQSSLIRRLCGGPVRTRFALRAMSSGARNDQEKPPKAKIYTRTGDKGQTSLFSGKRVPKTDGRVQALGTNDELSSNLGVAMEFCRLQPALTSLVDQLIFVQRRLQELNGHLASQPGKDDASASSASEFDVDGNFTRQLEVWIDEMDERLPALTSFILPSGGMASAHLHVARSVCRRAERSWIEAGGGSAEGRRFLNRLSDFLFTAARYVCHMTGNAEVPYKPAK